MEWVPPTGAPALILQCFCLRHESHPLMQTVARFRLPA